MADEEVSVIRLALSKLDAKNENHWTENGAPRLDALGMNPVPKRADVTAAAPLFTRANPVLPTEPVVEVKADPAPAAPVATNADKLAVLQAAVAEAEAEVTKHQDAVSQSQKLVAAAQVKHDTLVREMEKARPMHENIMGIRAVLERGKLEREAKAELAKELRKVGVTAKLLQSGSPLDTAMARKRGLGLNRPAAIPPR